MNFRDSWAKDEHGQKFVFTVEMQRRLSQGGLPVVPASLKLLGDTPAQTHKPARVASREERTTSASRARADDTEEMGTTDVVGPASIQIDPQTGKYIGRVKWYNARKGYGFIVRGAGEEIFFHKSSSVPDPESLLEGQWILYDVEETFKGPEATDIEPYDGETPE